MFEFVADMIEATLEMFSVSKKYTRTKTGRFLAFSMSLLVIGIASAIINFLIF